MKIKSTKMDWLRVILDDSPTALFWLAVGGSNSLMSLLNMPIENVHNMKTKNKFNLRLQNCDEYLKSVWEKAKKQPAAA
jgi:hypothetical protein